MVEIRAEQEQDYKAIHEVNERAFEGEEEARLVESIRKSPEFIPELSLVAIREGRIIGHILFSIVRIRKDNNRTPILALAPMAVLPEFQRQGIGSQLIQEGLEQAKQLGYRAVVVVGHPAYYPRFGFYPAKPKGLEVSFEVPSEAFLVCELFPEALDGVGGIIEYPPTFDEAV